LQRERGEALNSLENQKNTLQKDLDTTRTRTEDFNGKLFIILNQLEEKQKSFFLEEENLADTLKDFNNKIEEVSKFNIYMDHIEETLQLFTSKKPKKLSYEQSPTPQKLQLRFQFKKKRQC